MSANNMYRVTYHFEKSGKRCSETFQDNIIAADSSYNTLSAVLSGNSKTNNGQGTVVIEGFSHVSGSALS